MSERKGMLEKSRFSIFDHILNFFSRNKRDLWHQPFEVTPGYFAYTRQFDREVSGARLSEAIGPLNRDADDGFLTSVAGFQQSIFLQRKILGSGIRKQVESVKAAINARNVCVTILVDHSGSMRGAGIQLASLLTALTGKLLFDAGVKVEVLGFTTSSWKGGKSREFWLELGKQEKPGRLCDLLHVVHRSFDQPEPWNDNDVHTMLTSNLLKENVDGEALLWAEQRLLAKNATDRFLFVLSDGAPVDDSTLSANELPNSDSPILHDHLKSQIKRIQSERQVQLFAVGINFRVDQYYGSSFVMNGLDHMQAATRKIAAFVVERVTQAADGALSEN